MSFSLFSRARRSATETIRLEQTGQQEAGEFVQSPEELSAEDLRLVSGGDETAPKGGWVVPASITTTSTGS